MCCIPCNNTNTPRSPEGPGRTGGDTTMSRNTSRSTGASALSIPHDFMDRSTKPLVGKSLNATALANANPSSSSPATAQDLGSSSGALSTQIGGILDSLVQTASQVVGAVASGIKSLVDAGVGLFGLVTNIASEFLSFL